MYFRPFLQTALIAALAATSSCLAANYYVDFSAGNNSTAGTLPTAPWKNCPGDPAATLTPARTPLRPGDTVFLRAGTEYVGTILLKYSGSNSQPIIYDGRTWGAGSRAVVTTKNSQGAYGITTEGVKRDWLTIRGIDFADIGGIPDDSPIWTTPDPSDYANALKSVPPGTGISITGGGADIQIQDCVFREIGQWIPKKPVDGLNQIGGMGVSLENNSRVSITDCEFTKMKIGISIKAAASGTAEISDILVSGCNLHNYLTWPIDIAPRSVGVMIKNITIKNTEVHDYHEYDAGNWSAWGEKPHTDGIFLRTSGSSSTWENITIDSCRFYADDKGLSEGGTATIYVSEGPSVTVRNCVFTGTRHSNGDVVVLGNNRSAHLQTVKVFNNTFFGSTRPVRVSGETNSAKREIYIANNIFFREATSLARDLVYAYPTTVLRQLDYNLYYTQFSQDKHYVFFDTAYRTFAQMRDLGFEPHGIWSNPSFVDATNPTETLASKNNLSIKIGSAANSKALNLSSQFSHDIRGLQRPSTGSWDIGSYQVISTTAAPPSRPTGFRIEDSATTPTTLAPETISAPNDSASAVDK